MKRWCNSIPQYNLFTSCFEDINIYRHGRSMVWSNPFEIKTNISRPISNQLMNRIFEELNKMVEIKREEGDWVGAWNWIQFKAYSFGTLPQRFATTHITKTRL